MPSVDNAAAILLKNLRLLGAGIFLALLSMVIAAGVLMAINSTVGWQKYPVPGILFLLYLLLGIASPVVGTGSFVILFTRRQNLFAESGPEERRLRNQVLILSALNVMAIVLWVILLPLMLLSAGASR